MFSNSQIAILAAADIIRKHPELSPWPSSNDVWIWTYSDEDFREKRRILGGQWEKDKDHQGLVLVRKMEFEGGVFFLKIQAPSGACKKVQVGTEIQRVKKVVVPEEVEWVDEEVPVWEVQCPDVVSLEDDAEIEETAAEEAPAERSEA